MERELTHRVTAEVRAEASRLKMTQVDLARAAGLTVATTRRYFFTDEREPTLSAVIAAASALRLSVAELFRRAEGATPVRVERPVVRDAAPPATFQPPQHE